MKHGVDSDPSPRRGFLVVLTHLLGIAVLAACGPVAPPPTASTRVLNPPAAQPASPHGAGIVPHQSAAEIQEPAQTSTGGLVGSSKGRTYHRAVCGWAVRIHAGNRIEFQAVEEARTRGYRPCRTCCTK